MIPMKGLKSLKKGFNNFNSKGGVLKGIEIYGIEASSGNELEINDSIFGSIS